MRETRDHAIAFADLADSTRLFRELGDAAARDLTQDFYRRAASVLPPHDGRLVKTLGDGVMCAFADADHAVLAMSALHEQLAASQLPQQPLRIHSGISAGSVIVEGADIFGTVVNVAAYLAAIARTNQILATQAVVDRLSAPVRACARAAYAARLKGDDRDSLVHEILWQADRAAITHLNLAAVGTLPADEGALQFLFGSGLHRVNAFRPRLALGRDAGNDIVVADDFASRAHAMVEVDTLRFKLIDRSANGTYVALDGAPGEARVLRGETVLHGSGRISLGRPLSDPLAQPIVFRRDQRALYRV
ncbi:MAG: adenylate/guanylate cyclase domain-containing protein [Betaproteobacteria bacterium]|nr:adenylate/guanylate cyclase domain-containing protein [Betaproteobacteria bacterium]MDH4325331.1 adenylate/guanylate cyclase domain-containing protein [Betaproteobacteria bacterium]MDH5210599.1 adenylate/guanylate cyclase domain-containing protein [Betaproteobacteria bacterium]